MKLSLKIITPSGIDFEGEVDSIVIPTEIGEIEVLPEHRPIITILVPGGLVLKNAEKRDIYAVDQGFARVSGNVVSIITDELLNMNKADFGEIEQATRRAEQALEDARNNRSAMDPMEVERLEAKVRYQMAKKLICKH
ncbi:MAG: ATP synthase F1 subunit epsilon [Puniceicoccales bacterium]|jgi:F-type H+-transporting ATPase subunit epsilon|nr:ATP synthase F1 subunit epsilon [Puniceicoccales bacterium]